MSGGVLKEPRHGVTEGCFALLPHQVTAPYTALFKIRPFPPMKSAMFTLEYPLRNFYSAQLCVCPDMLSAFLILQAQIG